MGIAPSFTMFLQPSSRQSPASHRASFAMRPTLAMRRRMRCSRSLSAPPSIMIARAPRSLGRLPSRAGNAARSFGDGAEIESSRSRTIHSPIMTIPRRSQAGVSSSRRRCARSESSASLIARHASPSTMRQSPRLMRRLYVKGSSAREAGYGSVYGGSMVAFEPQHLDKKARRVYELGRLRRALLGCAPIALFALIAHALHGAELRVLALASILVSLSLIMLFYGRDLQRAV